MKFLKNASIFIIIFSFIFNCVMVSAENSDFSWNEFDSGYVTFVVDDGRPSLSIIHDMFKKYDMPLSAAIVASHLDENSENYNPSLIDVLIDIENHGGEILSHTYDHTALTEDSTLADAEYQFSNSYHILTNQGFTINGIIEAGCGGKETTADYAAIETVTAKYYKYSDRYGVSPQFRSVRTGVSDETLGSAKASIIRAARNNDWVILMCHDFNDLSVEGFKEILDLVKKTDNMKMVTYRDMYEKFGNYTEKQDFGNKKYTVSYIHNDTIISSEVLPSGSQITPPKAPEGYKWDTELSVADYNYTVKSVKIEDNDNQDQDKPNEKKSYLLPIITALIVATITPITIIFSKRKKNKK